MGYRPNAAARQLAGIGSKLIGVLIDAHGLSIEYPRVSFEEEFANSSGYRLVVGQCRPDIGEIKSYLDDFSSRGLDGIIIHAHGAYPGLRGPLVEAAQKAFTHVIYADRPDGVVDGLSFADINLSAGMRRLVSHNFERGRRKIVYFVPYKAFPAGKYRSFRERERGFREEMDALGLGYDPNFAERHILPVEPRLEHLRPALKDLLARERPDAIIARNDEVAAMTVRILREFGVSIPGDVAVSGFDNRPLCEYLTPSLTSVDNNFAMVSRAAVEGLVKMIEGEARAPFQAVIDPTLVIRESA
jgi:DNA-binding LacI/PurR family transcriptional regulator